MKIAIVGSRRMLNRKRVIDLVRSLPKDSTIVSGGCKGVDVWAEEVAEDRNMDTIIFKPDLSGIKSKLDGINRYYERNIQIAEACDVLYAFVSKDRVGGTENTIKYAKEIGKKVYIMEWTRDSDRDVLSDVYLKDEFELLR